MLIEVDNWAQAQQCADDIGGTLLGEKESDSGWVDIAVTNLIN